MCNVHFVGEEQIHMVLRNSRNVGNQTALASLSMGFVVINNNQFIRFNLDYVSFLVLYAGGARVFRAV